MSLYPTAEIQWKDGPVSLPAGAKVAVLEGDPSKEGFFTMRLLRQCCPFLRFAITVEPGNGPIWLEMTGPEGTKEFLATTFT
jgi:hypothetical protein